MAEYIEREALVHHFMTTRQYLTKDLVMDAAYEVSKIPAADVAPVVYAKWIDGADSFGAKRGQFRVCSRCNICFPRDDRIVPPAYWQGCPNCLARMDGE